MSSEVVDKKEVDKTMDFIRDTKNGKYTAGKPDLTHIAYSRIEIQEGEADNVFSDCSEYVILYGMS
jgi:hypothetical protein